MANKKGRSLSDNDMSNVTGGLFLRAGDISINITKQEIQQCMEERNCSYDEAIEYLKSQALSLRTTPPPGGYDPDQALG